MRDLYRKHALIAGRVQGVGFRWYARERATELGLTGWVRNLPDGRVEMSFQGPKIPVERMAAWCAKGSPTANVRAVEISDELLLEHEHAFEVR